MYTHPFNPVFYMLIAEKSPEIFPKHKGCFFNFRIFSFELIHFYTLRNKITFASIICRLKQNFLFDLEKLIEYWVSVVNVVSSYPCVGPLPRVKISFPLSSVWSNEPISTPKMTTFLPRLPPGN